MVSVSRTTLQTLLVERYNEIAQRLNRRLKSRDLADEALQETYLRLERGGDLEDVRNPSEYLYRIALNVARDRQRTEVRRASRQAIDEIFDLADDRPGPAETIEARSEILALDRALQGLPPRRREIFLLAWGEGVPHREIAARHGLSIRMINMELAKAREYCALQMKTGKVVRFRNHDPESSRD